MRQFANTVQNQPVDMTEEFTKQENHFFIGSKVEDFDRDSASGKIRWKGQALKQRVSYHQLTPQFEDYKVWEDVPPEEYEDEQDLPFSITFITPRTVRLQMSTQIATLREGTSLMLDGEPDTDESWRMSSTESSTTYTSKFGAVTVTYDPLHFEFRDASGKLLTRTQHLFDSMSVVNTRPTPFSFVRTASSLRRHIAASFSLSSDEKLFGCGESFTRLDKRGQKLVLWTYDAYSVQTPDMYKPVPFFMSNRGYGMFVHTSAPLTLDLGASYNEANVMYLGDDYLDLFVFFGTPKEILSEYTALTGRSPTPPLWSFGLWMGRESYYSEDEVRGVAKKLRDYRIPSDVVHLDVGWFEVPHRCDYKFSESRFSDAAGMISDLKEQGFRLSLWQLPYLNPKNPLHWTAIEEGYVVLTATGDPPADDAIIDMSNPRAVEWYQEKLARLLEMGVGLLVADFGEAASLGGIYSERKSGFREHNLYPLRYNKAVAEITEKITGKRIMWARSAWAGCQRYPVHWGGDAENTDGAMASSLRGGLSLGLCGFSFWGHFIGGFVYQSPKELYRRWLAFAMLSSHGCCNGSPPKEPWEYDEEFTNEFRRIVELKYRLMPYIYAQAKRCSEEGYPMLRTLFFEYPEDLTSWLIEDEYMFGGDILVAPLMEDVPGRDVYLPPGLWIDYQSGETYEGSGWHHITAGEVPIVVLVRDGAAIPHVELAQSTSHIEWQEIELVVFGSEAYSFEGSFCLPEEGELHALRLKRENGNFVLKEDPLRGSVKWEIRTSHGLPPEP
ncbi:MAG: alpha-xylosidase [Actinomycetota bacterium]|nr:alpha-xylosidase [Actinomycetota bacterium]